MLKYNPEDKAFPDDDRQTGMTMRQWYKGQIIKAITNLEVFAVSDEEVKETIRILASMSGKFADLMIEEDKQHAEKDLS